MITIEIGVNDGWFEGTYLMVYSLVKRTKETIQFYCLSGNFTELNPKNIILSKEHEQIIDKMVKSFNPKNSFKVLDCTNLFHKTFPNLQWRKMWAGPYAMMRLLLHKIPQFKGKVIHLDIDLMLNGDIRELYDSDLHGAEIAATRDRVLLFKNWRRYFNAGVMLMDIDKIREKKSFDRCVKYVLEKRPFMLDQDAINKYCKIIRFPGDDYRFNYQRPDIKDDTLIKHFFSSYRMNRKKFKIRQWEIDRVQNVLHIHYWDEDYKHFLKEKEKWNKK
ncbi:MAG: glycosyltransferase family 8 protein [Mycoplasmoidaceae bacterium]